MSLDGRLLFRHRITITSAPSLLSEGVSKGPGSRLAADLPPATPGLY